MDLKRNEELSLIACNIRKDIIEGIYCAKSGHPGGSLGIADILSVLYFREMNVSVDDRYNADRDRFVLSKGHCAPALYGTLAEKGFFDRSEMKKLRHFDSFLQGHPDMKSVPGVDASTGSLGQGVSIACGMAISGKIYKRDYRVYTILGDGELNEGQVWEALMFAAHYKLDNLVVIVDLNGLQIDGETKKVMDTASIVDKFLAFNFKVFEIDGHDYDDITTALSKARLVKGSPCAIIAKTIKGKGVSFMEGDYSWHGAAPNEEQYKQAMEELDALCK